MGFGHGGDDAKNYKPNYFSQMNYHWSMTGVQINGSYQSTYQYFTGPDVKEYDLDEATGLNVGTALAGYTVRYYCPLDKDYKPTGSAPADGPIDWNCDDDTTDTNLSLDVNRDRKISTLHSINDLDTLRFDGGNRIGP